MKQQIEQNNDGWTPREQRFFESSRHIKDPEAGQRCFCTNDRSLAAFLVYRNHEARHVLIADEPYCAFLMTEHLENSLELAAREDGIDLFLVVDQAIEIFSDLLVNEALAHCADFPDGS